MTNWEKQADGKIMSDLLQLTPPFGKEHNVFI